MGKKNLDKLFQEKFKDFSKVPDEEIWQRITASLDKKKKSKKIIPFWWKLSGAAAVLAFLFFTVNPFENASDEQNPAVITNVKKSEEKNGSQKHPNILESTNSAEDAIVDVTKENQDPTIKPSDNNSILKGKVDKNAVVTSEAATEQLTTKTPNLENQNTKTAKNKDYVQYNNEGEGAIKGSGNENGAINNKKEALLASNTKKKESAFETHLSEEDTTRLKSEIVNQNRADSNDEAVTKVGEENSEIEKKKKSIYDAIEDLEKEELVENKEGKWAVGASVAPVYFNSFGDGSPIHSSFVPNSKSGHINMSYGLSVSYQISKKLSFRSGLNKVDYGYDTNDVEFSSSLASSTNGEITNINYVQTSENLVVESVKSSNGLVQKDAFVEIARNGVMGQQFGYLEIPMELNYALINNRFGIDLVGGVSSLFLIDNSVALTSGELTTQVGEANNLNSVNFSTNVGFGINYKVTPKIRLNVEPVFKYQLNTFSNTAGDFQPFSLGVYSGLNFKF